MTKEIVITYSIVNGQLKIQCNFPPDALVMNCINILDAARDNLLAQLLQHNQAVINITVEKLSALQTSEEFKNAILKS